MQVRQQTAGENPEAGSVAGSRDQQRLGHARVACPGAKVCRSGSRLVASVANTAMFDGAVSRIAGG